MKMRMGMKTRKGKFEEEETKTGLIDMEARRFECNKAILRCSHLPFHFMLGLQ